jgi:Ni,Fe-hydrogenase III large subunit
MIGHLLDGLPPVEPRARPRSTASGGPVLPPPGRASSGVGIVEGWRGTITHRVELAADGTLTRVKIADPSFFNWPALPVALSGAIVPDFPLVNKNFNLSYAGNDL